MLMNIYINKKLLLEQVLWCRPHNHTPNANGRITNLMRELGGEIS